MSQELDNGEWIDGEYEIWGCDANGEIIERETIEKSWRALEAVQDYCKRFPQVKCWTVKKHYSPMVFTRQDGNELKYYAPPERDRWMGGLWPVPEIPVTRDNTMEKFK